jgi:hypothetical protein
LCKLSFVIYIYFLLSYTLKMKVCKKLKRAQSVNFPNKTLTIELLRSFKINRYLASYGVRDGSTEVNFFQYPFLFNQYIIFLQMQQALRRISHFISFAFCKKGMVELPPLLREIISENNVLLKDFVEELKKRNHFKPSKYHYYYF